MTETFPRYVSIEEARAAVPDVYQLEYQHLDTDQFDPEDAEKYGYQAIFMGLLMMGNRGRDLLPDAVFQNGDRSSQLVIAPFFVDICEVSNRDELMRSLYAVRDANLTDLRDAVMGMFGQGSKT